MYALAWYRIMKLQTSQFNTFMWLSQMLLRKWLVRIYAICRLSIRTSFMIFTLVCLFRWGLAGQPSPFYFQSFGDILPRPPGVLIYGFTNLILEQPSSNHLGRIYVCGVDVQGGNLITTNTTVTAPRKCNLSQSTPMILLIRTLAMNCWLYPSWSTDTSLSRAYILVQMVSILWLYTEHSEFQVV